MSRRTRIELQDTYVDIAEFGWDKSNDLAWKRQEVALSPLDNPAIRHNSWWVDSASYPRFEEIIEDESAELPSVTSKFHMGATNNRHFPRKGRHRLRRVYTSRKPKFKKQRLYSRGLQFNNCLHTMQLNRFYAPTMPIRSLNASSSNLYLANLNSGYIAASLGVRAAPDIDMDDYADQALAFMYPRLDEGNPLVNFVLELKDLKHMNPGPSVKRVLQRRDALRALSTRKGRKEFTKELISRLNGAALGTTFGTVPFVGDLVKFYDELTTLSGKLARLKAFEGKVITRHYTRVIPNSDGTLPTYDWSPLTIGGTFGWPSNVNNDGNVNSSGRRDPIQPVYLARWSRLPTYHATWRYVYTLDHMSDLEEQIATHLDTLGVRLDPGIVWDAIPFSFVIDWIVDVSSFLHSFARNNYPIRVVSGGFIHSYGYASESAINLYMSDVGSFSGFNSILAAHGAPTEDSIFQRDVPNPGYTHFTVYRGVRSYYNRVKADPSLSTIVARAPKLRQIALSGSLLLSRIRGLNTTKYHFRPRTKG